MTTQATTAAALADPRTFGDPKALYELYRRLRRDDPVARVDASGHRPFRAVTRHADIMAVERAPQTFQAGPRTVLLPEKVEEIYLRKYGDRNGVKPLTHMDGDYHRDHRNVTKDWFMPRHLKQFEPRVAEIAKEFVDRMEDMGGSCDFAADLAFLYPLRVILTLMGVPREDEAQVLRMTQRLFSPADKDLKANGRNETGDVVAEFADYYHALGEKRRAEPKDDIVSTIANGLVAGCPMARREMTSYYVIVSTAGHDTTAASVAGGLHALIEHPDEFARLRADLGMLPRAAEEFVRYAAPVRHFMRTAGEETEVGGHRIAAGESLMLCYPSACRDETVFPDGDVLRVDRPLSPPHLAFGYGPHFCLGKPLALMEIRAFFAELLPRLKSVELAGDPAYIESVFVGGLKQLPLHYRFG